MIINKIPIGIVSNLRHVGVCNMGTHNRIYRTSTSYDLIFAEHFHNHEQTFINDYEIIINNSLLVIGRVNNMDEKKESRN